MIHIVALVALGQLQCTGSSSCVVAGSSSINFGAHNSKKPFVFTNDGKEIAYIDADGTIHQTAEQRPRVTIQCLGSSTGIYCTSIGGDADVTVISRPDLTDMPHAKPPAPKEEPLWPAPWWAALCIGAVVALCIFAIASVLKRSPPEYVSRRKSGEGPRCYRCGHPANQHFCNAGRCRNGDDVPYDCSCEAFSTS